ncbi:MAG: hypothetical protein ACRYG5_05580 [Janthinobacterium lividum]
MANANGNRPASSKSDNAPAKNLREVGKPADKTHEKSVDDSVDMTFPASDPPAHGGVTKLKEKPKA